MNTIGGNLVTSTLGRAMSGIWDMFWPVLIPIGLLLVGAFLAYGISKFTNVG